MAGNWQPCPGVRDGVTGDPRDTVKVELLETQSPGGATLTPAGKTPENRCRPLRHDSEWHAAILRGAGAMSCQDIQGDGRDT